MMGNMKLLATDMTENQLHEGTSKIIGNTIMMEQHIVRRDLRSSLGTTML